MRLSRSSRTQHSVEFEEDDISALIIEHLRNAYPAEFEQVPDSQIHIVYDAYQGCLRRAEVKWVTEAHTQHDI